MAGLKNKKSSKIDIAEKYKQQLKSIKQITEANLCKYFTEVRSRLAPTTLQDYKKIGYDEKKLGAKTFATKSWKQMNIAAKSLQDACDKLGRNGGNSEFENFKDRLENFVTTLYDVSEAAKKNSSKRIGKSFMGTENIPDAIYPDIAQTVKAHLQLAGQTTLPMERLEVTLNGKPTVETLKNKIPDELRQELNTLQKNL